MTRCTITIYLLTVKYAAPILDFRDITLSSNLRGIKMRWWRDFLFLFAVVAGLVYEMIYEPIIAVFSYCVRVIVAVTTSVWKWCRDTVAELPSRS